METIVIAVVLLVVAGILIYLASKGIAKPGNDLLKCGAGSSCEKDQAACTAKNADFILNNKVCKTSATSKEDDGYCCVKDPLK